MGNERRSSTPGAVAPREQSEKQDLNLHYSRNPIEEDS